jgi:hypothetical protein
MTAPAAVTATSVREYLGLNAVSGESKYSDTTIGSNIRAATWALARATGRVFVDETATKKFTTNGAAYLTIPGLRTASSISLQGTALTADSTYYLVPDVQQTGVYTGIQFRAFGTGRGGPWYLSNPEWFDRNLDRYPYGPWGGSMSLPNDLTIAGSWGYASHDSTPEPYLHAVKVLAAYYTKRPDALLSGAISTDQGSIFDLSRFPVEVRAFIEEWKVGPWMTTVG